MTVVRPVPSVGSVHPDARGDGHALRVSWHAERGDVEGGVVVLSVWRDNVCTGTVRLAPEQVPALVATLEQFQEPASDGGEQHSLPA